MGDEDPQHFGAELQAIWVVAKEDIPPAAAAYRDCVGKLNNTRTAVDAAMRRPAYFAEDAPSVHDAWVGLHDTVTKFPVRHRLEPRSHRAGAGRRGGALRRR